MGGPPRPQGAYHQMSTGWFGIPGKTPPVDGKVHAVHQGKTICGWKPESPYQFQWCAHGINLPMIDCSKCHAAGEKFLAMIAKVNTSGRAYRGANRIQ